MFYTEASWFWECGQRIYEYGVRMVWQYTCPPAHTLSLSRSHSCSLTPYSYILFEYSSFLILGVRCKNIHVPLHTLSLSLLLSLVHSHTIFVYSLRIFFFSHFGSMVWEYTRMVCENGGGDIHVWYMCILVQMKLSDILHTPVMLCILCVWWENCVVI